MTMAATARPLDKEIDSQGLFRAISGFILHQRVYGMTREVAGDLASETLQVVLEKYRPDFQADADPEEAVRRFAFGVAKGQLGNWKRKHFRYNTLFRTVDSYQDVEDLAVQVAASPEEEFERKETDQAIRCALEALPEDYRLAVYLRLQGHSISEMADLLSITSEAVKVRLHRARAKLEAQLNDAREEISEKGG